MRNFKFLLIFLIFIYPAAVFASSIAAVSTFTVGKDDMNGMLVDIDFADSSGMTDITGRVWGSTPYGVSGNNGGWALTYTGSDTQGFIPHPTDPDNQPGTWLFDWVLSTEHAIDNFTIHALPGNTVFDIVYDGASTAGSEGGIWLPNGESGRATSGTEVIPWFTTFDWEFSDPVYISGQSPIGDLYSTLHIDFLTDFTGNFQFLADTDNITPVPEPASILLLGFGLLGLAAARRRKI